MTHLFCFGLGYSANRLAARLAKSGWTISGTSRNAAGVAALAANGHRGHVFNGDRPNPAITNELKRTTHVLMSIPPDDNGDPALKHHGADIAASPAIRWIGYFSTIGVYGDSGGGWVDEETPPHPGSERGQRRLAAEQSWLALAQHSDKVASIFRLPGIYGPGRSTIEDLRAGRARRLIKPGQVFNRIHVDDIATAVEASLTRTVESRVYNITDDEPAAPQDVVAYGAELLGLPIPPDIDFATATLTEMGRSFYSESKRVANARMKTELGITLAFPTYREGLQAIAKGQT